MNVFAPAIIALLASLSQADARPVMVPGTYGAIIVRVVDGDTIHVTVSSWRNTPFESVSIRAFGIDTPETKKINAKCALELQRGQAATDYARTLLKPGNRVRFHYVGADKYFRVDATIALPDGRDFSQAMLAAGLAKPYSGRGPKPDWCSP